MAKQSTCHPQDNSGNQGLAHLLMLLAERMGSHSLACLDRGAEDVQGIGWVLNELVNDLLHRISEELCDVTEDARVIVVRWMKPQFFLAVLQPFNAREHTGLANRVARTSLQGFMKHAQGGLRRADSTVCSRDGFAFEVPRQGGDVG